jgi:hypothetical protein
MTQIKDIRCGIKFKPSEVIVFDPPLYLEKMNLTNALVSIGNVPIGYASANLCINGNGIESTVKFEFYPNDLVGKQKRILTLVCGDTIDLYFDISTTSNIPSTQYYLKDLYVSCIEHHQMITIITCYGNNMVYGKDALVMLKREMYKREPFIFR